MKKVNWAHVHELWEIDEMIEDQTDYDNRTLMSADQIISVSYNADLHMYVVIWKV